jgi:hypothetical protein
MSVAASLEKSGSIPDWAASAMTRIKILAVDQKRTIHNIGRIYSLFSAMMIAYTYNNEASFEESYDLVLFGASALLPIDAPTLAQDLVFTMNSVRIIRNTLDMLPKAENIYELANLYTNIYWVERP